MENTKQSSHFGPFRLLALAALMTLSALGSDPAAQAGWTAHAADGSSSLSAEEYEDSLTGASWVQSGHLYIHYLRDDPNSYSLWSVWAWQKVPEDHAGQTFNWTRYDQSGAIVDINLNATDFTGTTKLGFLIVLTSSQSSTSGMWTSDSGGDVYVTELPTHVRSDGTIHLFATQGNSLDYTFTYTGESVSDPYANDKGGDFVSKNNVNSSLTNVYSPAATSQDFYQNAGVGYQIQVASFSDSDGDGFGDLQGIIDKLSYIDSLNVDVIWLTPVQECESYHGYDTIDYYNIDSRFGTLADYRELTYKAHQRGIRIIMDLVVNHTSLNNVWFRKSVQLKTGKDISAKDIDYRNFYHWKYSVANLAAPWYRYGTTNYHYYAKFSSGMPELNYDYQGTRDAMVDVAKYWLGFGLDGFRIDAVKHVYMQDEVTAQSGDVIVTDGAYSNNKTKNINFFKEFSNRIKGLYPDAFIVGENFDGWDARISQYYQGMDSLLDFAAYYHFVYNTFYSSGENTANVEATNVVTNKYSIYNTQRANGKAINSAFTSNHDVERMLNHVNNTLSGSQSSVSETHAAINTSNAATALSKAKVYAAAQIMQPGLCWIYYGDEIGMSGNIMANDGINSPASAIGHDWNEDRWYRQPMKWSSDGSDTHETGYEFNGYTVTWDNYNKNTLVGAAEQASDSESLLYFIQVLTFLKSAAKETLVSGSYAGISSSDKMFSFSRTGGGKTIRVYCNFGTSAVSISGGGALLLGTTGATTTSVPGYGVAIIQN